MPRDDGSVDEGVFWGLRPVEPRTRAEASLAELEGMAAEIDDLRAALRSVVEGADPREAHKSMEQVRRRIVALVAQRLVPVASNTFDLAPLVALEKIVTASLQRLDVHERPDGFEWRDPSYLRGPDADHHRQLAFAAVALFSKSHYPESISWTKRDADWMLVRTRPD